MGDSRLELRSVALVRLACEAPDCSCEDWYSLSLFTALNFFF